MLGDDVCHVFAADAALHRSIRRLAAGRLRQLGDADAERLSDLLLVLHRGHAVRPDVRSTGVMVKRL